MQTFTANILNTVSEMFTLEVATHGGCTIYSATPLQLKIQTQADLPSLPRTKYTSMNLNQNKFAS